MYASSIVHATKNDYAVLGSFYLSAECCLVLSTTFHLRGFRSCAAAQTWLFVDLFGIVVLTAGTFISGIYYAFLCDQSLQILHWSIVSTSQNFSS